MKTPFTPRHLRKGQNSSPGDTEKKKGFRRAKQWSDQFIHQKAGQLFKGATAGAYAAWCAKANSGKLRR